jgi:hypothetical protein
MEWMTTGSNLMITYFLVLYIVLILGAFFLIRYLARERRLKARRGTRGLVAVEKVYPQRALVLNKPGVGENVKLVLALEKTGCEVVQIENTPEGWAEIVELQYCIQEDFTLVVFNGGRRPVGSMVGRFTGSFPINAA